MLTRLDARSLVMSALACRHWCGVAAYPLAATRTARAQVRAVQQQRVAWLARGQLRGSEVVPRAFHLCCPAEGAL